eukprot:2086281-Pleurochrysis_carterae.AAC.1
MHRTNERAVAPVRERRDDQPARVAEVLHVVVGGRVHHAHEDASRFWRPVVAQLRHPFKLRELVHVRRRHLLRHVALVNVHGHESTDGLAVHRRQLAPDL